MRNLSRAPFLILVVLVIFMVGTLSAQEPVITSETPVDQGTLHEWLHSADPRLVAWAADFARRRHEASILADMPDVIEYWPLPPSYRHGPLEGQRRAVLALLDALIQEEAEIPVRTIETIASPFPEQAAILIGRLPLSASRNTLNQWTYATAGGWGEQVLARIAAMMLAKDPVPSQDRSAFVARIVDASEDELHISVRAANSAAPPGMGFGSCGEYLGDGPAPGWPLVYTHGLDEADHGRANGPVVVDLDGDQMFSWRHPDSSGGGSCSGVEGLTPSTRHRLLAYWLGVSERDMSWQPVRNSTIVWTNYAAYLRQLGRVTEAERLKLSATVQSLRDRGLLRNNVAMPRLVMTIECEMTPCPLPGLWLPPLHH